MCFLIWAQLNNIVLSVQGCWPFCLVSSPWGADWRSQQSLKYYPSIFMKCSRMHEQKRNAPLVWVSHMNIWREEVDESATSLLRGMEENTSIQHCHRVQLSNRGYCSLEDSCGLDIMSANNGGKQIQSGCHLSFSKRNIIVSCSQTILWQRFRFRDYWLV